MTRGLALKILLVLVGLFFVAGVYPLVMSLRHRNPSDYPDQMMLSVYVTLGIFLLLAVRNPLAHRSLIAFTGWSSVAHVAVMMVQSVQVGNERSEMPGLGGIGVVFVALLGLLSAATAKARYGGFSSTTAKAPSSVEMT